MSRPSTLPFHVATCTREELVARNMIGSVTWCYQSKPAVGAQAPMAAQLQTIFRQARLTTSSSGVGQ